MTAILHTLRDLGIGFLYSLAIFWSLLALYLLAVFAVVAVERWDRRQLLRTQDKELQQAMEDWPKPVLIPETPVDFEAAIAAFRIARHREFMGERQIG